MSGTAADPWTSYWRAGGAGRNSGCLPGAPPEVESALGQVWDELARELKRGAKVLDLATGSGAVLRRMLSVRPGLALAGVDSASDLPEARGIKLKPNVRMERLPFRDLEFDAITSQFGVEYGDVPAIAMEAARVARRYAALRIVTHHANGPVVRHNLERRAALAWASEESGLLAKARALARARATTPLPTPTTFRQAVTEAQGRFPTQNVAAEFAAAVLQTLEAGRHRPARESAEVLDTLDARARAEIARIDELSKAALDTAGIAALVGSFQGAGFVCEPPEALEADALPFAWMVRGKRLQPQAS